VLLHAGQDLSAVFCKLLCRRSEPLRHRLAQPHLRGLQGSDRFGEA